MPADSHHKLADQSATTPVEPDREYAERDVRAWLQILKTEYKGTEDPKDLTRRVLSRDPQISKKNKGEDDTPKASSGTTKAEITFAKGLSILSISSVRAAVYFFLLTASILTVIVVIGVQRGRREQQQALRNLAANSIEFLEQLTKGTGQPAPQIKATGNANVDVALSHTTKFLGQWLSYLLLIRLFQQATIDCEIAVSPRGVASEGPSRSQSLRRRRPRICLHYRWWSAETTG